MKKTEEKQCKNDFKNCAINCMNCAQQWYYIRRHTWNMCVWATVCKTMSDINQ